jgi:hypothetical protein
MVTFTLQPLYPRISLDPRDRGNLENNVKLGSGLRFNTVRLEYESETVI